MSTDTSTDQAAPASEVDPAVAGQIALRSGLRTLVECCHIVEEGICNTRETDLAMSLGAGVTPGPFARVDEAGLDIALQSLEWAAGEWGEAFAPPVLLRRLVAQGRLGKKTGQGFYVYPQPDAGEQTENVLVETRGPVAVVWLNRPPVNPISPSLVAELHAVHARLEADDSVRAVVIASANNAIFSAGADLKAFAEFGEGGVEAFMRETHAAVRALETGRLVTIAAVNGAALGGGCELALACDLRIVAESASFGLPEITLGIFPGFGATQRLKRVTGQATAIEMMTTGDQIGAWDALEVGLANDVVPDHELFDTALALAQRIAAQAPRAIGHIKKLVDDPTLDADLEREIEAFVDVFATQDAVEGIGAFLQKRRPRFTGK